MNNRDKPRSWHDYSSSDVACKLSTSAENGLTTTEVDRRLQQFGANSLPSMPSRSVVVKLFSQLNNILIIILLAAAVATLLLGEVVDSIIIFTVVFINTLIGFIQEGKAEKAIAAVQGMLSLHATVFRENKRMIILASELVPGDLVLLQSGDKVPADLRLTRDNNLKINEAILTGESNTVEKNTGILAASTPLAERINMAFSGTLVTSGKGEGIVVATGSQTEIGKINQLLITVQQLETPLLKKITTFGRGLSAVILSITGVLFLIGFFYHQLPGPEIFMASVGIMVAAIPEGLPVILTLAMAIGVQRMAKRNAIIRRLPAVETLGSVSLICSDKTGTLTRNEMFVQKVSLLMWEFDVTGSGYTSDGDLYLDGKPINPHDKPDLLLLGRVCLLCNDAELDFQENGPKLQGDPMEGALLALAAKMNLYRHQLEEHFIITDTIPFAAEHRFMASLYHHEGLARICIKGAPEVILDGCSFQLQDQNVVALDSQYWQQKVAALAEQGLRTLAIAYKDTSINHDKLEYTEAQSDLILIGLVGIIDPPRKEAIQSVKECHEAQIQVKMITGDHAITALAIAKQLGIGDGQHVLTGTQLHELDEQTFAQRIEEVDVFARTSPEDKLRLVETLQEKGHIIAMTGDGVNDAPALKRADIGVAMGLSGTEVTKESAEMVIIDDNFSSIVAAVKEGRTVYDNLKKAISFLLPINGGETLSLALAIIIGSLLPITPIQILWINMTSSVALGLSLAFESSEKNIMKRAPVSIKQPLLSGYLIWRIIFVSTLFLVAVFGVFHWSLWKGEGVDMARTMTSNTLSALEIAYLLSSRYMYGSSLSKNSFYGIKPVLIAIGVVIILQLCFTYMPIMQRIFKTESIDFWHLLEIVIIAILCFIIVESEKLLYLSRKIKDKPSTSRTSL